VTAIERRAEHAGAAAVAGIDGADVVVLVAGRRGGLLGIARARLTGHAGALIGDVALTRRGAADGARWRDHVGRARLARHGGAVLVRIADVARPGPADGGRRRDDVGRAALTRHAGAALLRIADVARAGAADDVDLAR